MRYLSVFMFFLLLLCASMASADEAIVRLLAHRSENYMKHLDQKEFLAIREMLDPEIIQRVPEDTFLKTMAALYGEVTIFYGKPKVSVTSDASAVASFRVTYFSKLDIGVGCQQIYWVQKLGQWFISHHIMASFSGCI